MSKGFKVTVRQTLRMIRPQAELNLPSGRNMIAHTLAVMAKAADFFEDLQL